MMNINLGSIFLNREVPSLPSVEAVGDFSNPMTPARNPGHDFPAWAVRALPTWWAMPPALGGGLFVTGPSGCGKSSTLREWCARTGTPLFQVTANGRLEFQDLVGRVALESDGNGGTRTSFVYGPLAMAMKEGGLFLLDELDLLDPSVCAGLNGVLDGSGLMIPENAGEYIAPHPMFRFAATGNSSGSGDSSGAYAGVMVQNAALMDRFTVVRADWLPRHRESALVESVPGGASGETLRLMMNFAESIRAEQGPLGVSKPLTTRSLRRWSAYIAAYVNKPAAALGGRSPVAAALMDAWASGLSEADAASVSETYQRVFGVPLSPDSQPASQSGTRGGSNE